MMAQPGRSSGLKPPLFSQHVGQQDKDRIMPLMIIGLIMTISSILMMRASNNQMVYLGMLMFIVGLLLIKKGREKFTRN